MSAFRLWLGVIVKRKLRVMGLNNSRRENEFIKSAVLNLNSAC